MTEKKEKEQKKKATPGMAATTNRLETSHAVLSSLKEADLVRKGDGAQNFTVYNVAQAVLSLLKVVQDCEDDIDEELVALVLDTCGLAYIVVNACETRGPPLSNTDFTPLTETIDAFRIFFNKKMRASLIRKFTKRGEDEKVVNGFKDNLRAWQLFIGGDETMSIHDQLENIIALKLRPQQRIQEPVAQVHQKKQPITLSSSYAQKPVPPTPIFPIPEVQIQFPSPTANTPSTSTLTQPTAPTPLPAVLAPVRRQPTPVTFPSSPTLKTSFDNKESEAKRKRRSADEQRKQEERERWKRSEEMYNALPPASPEDSTSQVGNSLDAITSHMKQSAILPQPKPLAASGPFSSSSVSLGQNNSRPVSPRPPPTTTGTVPPPPTEDDLVAARAKQVEEDRITAMLLAGKIQLELEAEERAREREKEKQKQKEGTTRKPSKTKHRPPAIENSGYGSDDSAGIPVRVESPSALASAAVMPTPYRTPTTTASSLSRSTSLSGARPASPKMPRMRRTPAPLVHASGVSSSASASSSSLSNELRLPPPLGAGAPRDYHHRDYSVPPPVVGPRRSSDAVRPLPSPSPLQQRFSAEDVMDEPPSGIYISNVSKSGISFGSGSVNVRNLGN